MFYKNFKTVTYCVAQWVNHISETELREQADFLQKYIGIDKIYLETFRDEFAKKEQIEMFKRVMKEYNIEVSGGITTVTPDLNESDKNRQRLFNTFCYCNEPMRKKLKEISEYTASLFDEFIIDDFYFTQCTCEDCLREKGERTWEEFRLEKMLEVSKNLIIKPAKKINPNIKIIIKYPNWRESYAQTGYNPEKQRDLFDFIYTGTETRHGAQTDQHLPRYLSYSLMRYMENVDPGRNGGGWFDPFDCDRIDTYLEQAYLTAFSKPKEIMLFCWPAIADNKKATPLGFMFSKLDAILSNLGEPQGLKTYIPFNSQGEDHIEDYLGMTGIPTEPVCCFPDFAKSSKVLVTAASLKDKKIIDKIEAFVRNGGHVIATSGFIIGAQKIYPVQISQLTSVKYNNRTLNADEYHYTRSGLLRTNYIKNTGSITFPLLEHRNNATWSLINAGHGEYHESIMCYETYGKGRFTILNVPDMPSKLYELPAEILTTIRQELETDGIWIDSEAGISLFIYNNKTFGLYNYTWDGCKPQEFNIHIKGRLKDLKRIEESNNKTKVPLPWEITKLEPLYTQKIATNHNDVETVFHMRLQPGDFIFFEIEK